MFSMKSFSGVRWYTWRCTRHAWQSVGYMYYMLVVQHGGFSRCVTHGVLQTMRNKLCD